MEETKNKIFKLSVIISIVLTFLVTPNFKQFGAPFQWVSYYGDKELYSSLLLLKPNNMFRTHFNIGLLALNILLIYLFLFYFYKNTKK